MRLTQVFWGETSECVCQGLRNVFEFTGGVPRRAIFDNATEVGRRVGGEIRPSELLRRFAAHYGLDYTFTNPLLGQREGQRREQGRVPQGGPLVPAPSFHDVAAFNRRLLGEDKGALSPLPPAAFSYVRWEARRRVDVALGAFDVTVCDASTGEVVATYEREWGEAPTDGSDPTLQLRLLCARPAGWRDSSVRASLPAEPVSFLDAEPPQTSPPTPGCCATRAHQGPDLPLGPLSPRPRPGRPGVRGGREARLLARAHRQWRRVRGRGGPGPRLRLARRGVKAPTAATPAAQTRRAAASAITPRSASCCPRARASGSTSSRGAAHRF